MPENAAKPSAADERARPYFAAAARGVLALQSCARCGACAFPLRARCAACGSQELGWRESAGAGRVFGHGRLERSSLPELEARLPITLLLVDLDEGVRIPARLAAGETARPRAGERVTLAFELSGDGTPLPVFRAAGNST
ncbi:MAG: Zn-ribbon domain-containing OB-fold protein [Myxococcota bacterium]